MTTFIRTSEAEAVEMDNEWVILHADQFTVTKLNEVGGLCWGLLGVPQSLEGLAEEVYKHYDIGENDAIADVRVFLDKLLEIGLIRHAG